MLKLYLILYYEFFKIGIFALGGGYASLPFLYYIQEKYNWFSISELTNMIAVSNITPGPIGINMATYTGYTTIGIIGAITATSAIVTAPFIFTITMIKLYTKFQSCKTVNYIFLGLRPAACALLASIGIKLFSQTFINELDYKGIILFIILIIPFSLIQKRPILVISAGAIGGIIINSF